VQVLEIAAMPEPIMPIPRAPSLVPPEHRPDYSQIVTEDDTPVDNLYSEKHQRLLMDAIYNSWPGPGGGRPFLACADVGIFYAHRVPPIVPDAFVSVDVKAPADPFPKENRSYFIWEYGKPPNVVVETVSNKEGEELGRKLEIYARLGAPYYVVWDPDNRLGAEKLHVFVLVGGKYEPLKGTWFPAINLGVTEWLGTYEDVDAAWLRWCDAAGDVLLTGAERAALEKQRADEQQERADLEQGRADQAQRRAEQEKQRAEQEKQRADVAVARTEQVKALLRAQGIELPLE
jgi:Uma2 family endonuclease